MRLISVLVILLVLILAGSLMALSIESDQLDEICSEDGQFLYRSSGVWVCGSAVTSASVGSVVVDSDFLIHADTCSEGVNCDFQINVVE